MQETSDIQLIPAERVSLSQRVAIMNAAYADYYVPMHVTQKQIALMDRVYDIDRLRSVVAHTRWESIGIALLAVRGDQAWVSGVGVVPAWRRRGVGRIMMEHLIASAREIGVRQITLEVIVQNTPARRLYNSLGFQVARELLTWQRPEDADPLPVPREHLSPAPAQELLENFTTWHNQPPCWQRAASTLRKMAERQRGYFLNWRGSPTAYCLVSEPWLVSESDDTILLTDVGINPTAGLLMPGRLLLQALAATYFGRALSIMNVPAEDSLNQILAALGFLVTVRQVEMVLDVNLA